MSDPVTAPDLVEVIAEALLSAELGRAFDRNEDMVAFKEDLEACRMDARAVLAALEAVGCVEWGTETVHEKTGAVLDRNVWQTEKTARSVNRKYGDRVVSRLTLPWTPEP